MIDVQAIKEGLIKALEDAQEGITLSQLEDMLADGSALLWTGERAVLVTQLHQTPGYRFLHGWLATGDLKEILEMVPGVSAWARARGCKFASINGRKGWFRAFKPLGFELVDGELRKYYV